MPDASSPTDPSRHYSHTEQPVDPIPIPEADARSRKARTVRIQDILAAHARALDVRLEEGMREMRLAMESAIRRSAIQEAPQAAPPPPQIQAPPPVAPPQPPPAPETQHPTLPRDDVTRGLAQQTEERFQSLALRLQRIEDAVRTVALARGDSGELGGKLEALTEGMNRVAASEEDLFDRLLEAQREGIEDLSRRVGAGVAAVIRAMQNELNATITRLELTADTTAAVSPGDTARLERTMMAIAEHQEAVLDDRLGELRQSMASLQQTEETAAEVEEALSLGNEEGTEDRTEATVSPEEPFPWPEPGPEDALPEEAIAEGSAPGPVPGEPDAAEEAPAAENITVEETTDPGRAAEAGEAIIAGEAEAGEAGSAEEPQVVEAISAEEVQEAEKPAKKKRRRRKKKSREPAETD